ncbi:MAG: hypothetical protein ACRDWD_00195, partial [Acidimicrobiia bacterium]
PLRRLRAEGGPVVHLSGGEFAVAVAALLLGALVQGSIGFGMNLVAVPVVALVAPEALPATLILVAFHGRLDGNWLRPALLTFCAVAGAVTVVYGLA